MTYANSTAGNVHDIRNSLLNHILASHIMKSLCLFFLLLFSFKAIAQIPEFKVTVYDSLAVKGYFFFAIEGNLVILDRYGALVYYKPNATGNDCDFLIQPNGQMSFTNSLSYPNYAFLLMDSTFTVTDTVKATGYATDFHGFKILPDGRYGIMAFDTFRADMSSFHYYGRQLTDTEKIVTTALQAIDGEGNVEFEWRTKYHFALDDRSDYSYPTNYQYFDWTHCNSFDIDTNGNVLLSSLMFNEITKINPENGQIIWRLGGKRNEFKFIDCPVLFNAQRNITCLPNGHITLFDGGRGKEIHGARAMEFEIDEKNKTATLVWSCQVDTSWSLSWGNVQRLENGNTLIDAGVIGTSDLSLVIVTPDCEKVFELRGHPIFRAHNYPTLPWKLHRPEIECFDSLGRKYLKTLYSYSSYQWNDSSTSRIIPVTRPGKYSVFVPYGTGGYISSETFTVTDLQKSCVLPGSGKQSKENKKKKG